MNMLLVFELGLDATNTVLYVNINVATSKHVVYYLELMSDTVHAFPRGYHFYF